MGASLLGRYPFGGALHHQYILFPFVVLSVFVVVDAIVARSHREWLAVAVVSAAVIVNSIVQWRFVQFVGDEPAARELETFARYFGDSPAVYVDQTNVIYFFASHHRGMWLPQRRLRKKVYALPVIEAGRRLLVLRDTKRWNFDSADRKLYGDLRRLIAMSQVPSIDLFWLSPDEQPACTLSQLKRVQLADSVVELANREGLRVEHVVLDGSHLYARLRLGGPVPQARSSRDAAARQSQPAEDRGDQPQHQARGATDYSVAAAGTTGGDGQNQPAVDDGD